MYKMTKFNFVLVILTKLFDFLKGITCKFNACCASNCSSECKRDDMKSAREKRHKDKLED